jgi:copper(I)-binding protein
MPCAQVRPSSQVRGLTRSPKRAATITGEPSPAVVGPDGYASHLVTLVAGPQLHRAPSTGARVAAFPRRRRTHQGRKDDPPVIRPGDRPASRAAVQPHLFSSRPARAVLVAGVVIGSVVLGGCGAGQIAQTAYQANASGGATVTMNGIAVRDAQITWGGSVEGENVYPVGGSAPVEMYVISESTQDDRLVSASSPVAASVTVSGQADLPAGTVMVVGGAESGTAGQTEQGASEPPALPPIDSALAPPTNATPVPSENSPSSAPNEPSDTSPTGPVAPIPGEAPAGGLQTLPPIAAVDPSTRYAQVVLTGLTEDIRSGLSYEIVLNFEKAGPIRVMLPVAYPGEPREPAEKE